VYATTFNKYERPIKTPIKNLRPAQETCERCHWPEKFTGNLDRSYVHYLADKKNTHSPSACPSALAAASRVTVFSGNPLAHERRQQGGVLRFRSATAGHPVIRMTSATNGEVRCSDQGFQGEPRGFYSRHGLHGLPTTAGPRLPYPEPGG